MDVRSAFRTAAKECSAKVRHLPKGQRLKAYRDCIKARMQVYGRNPVGPG